MATKLETQLKKVKAHLQSGKAISPLFALTKFGCFRLADIIYRLRRAPHKLAITTELVSSGGKVYGRYKM